ncbi:MAG: ATP-binding protein [Bacteroidetes bacterium]|nr:ATP-binding protein [Bacteroidota bacterium]
MTDQKYRLEIPSKPENISLVENFIENVCQDLDISDEVYGNILISVTEAVNNGMIHGNKIDETKKVELTLEEKDGVMTFTIRDDGPGFNFADLPDPTAPQNLEKPTGRGIFLMQQLSDEVKFTDEGREVEIQFKIK